MTPTKKTTFRAPQDLLDALDRLAAQRTVDGRRTHRSELIIEACEALVSAKHLGLLGITDIIEERAENLELLNQPEEARAVRYIAKLLPHVAKPPAQPAPTPDE